MSILLIAGPPAVGHNTVAELICARRGRVALVDCDDIRALVRAPYAAPWEGLEGEYQYLLGIDNCCALARAFDAARFDVLLLDVAPPETLDRYRNALAGVTRLVIVQLTATPETLVDRDRTRDEVKHADQSAWHDRIRKLQQQLADSAGDYDHVIDTTEMTADQVAQRCLELLA
jgi:hypothetical protein